MKFFETTEEEVHRAEGVRSARIKVHQSDAVLQRAAQSAAELAGDDVVARRHRLSAETREGTATFLATSDGLIDTVLSERALDDLWARCRHW